MRIKVRFFICLLLLFSVSAQAKTSSLDIDIPFSRFTLKNGLTLLVHEDHKAPIAAVNVWYHVGSKNEKAGKTGFAHLFEHLMFNGSENFNDDYFKALEKVGATSLNGTTNEDRTNYFQNVPVTALDLVLWLESDRMGHLLGAISQAKLDEQRGVVQNEKRQRENQPYGMSYEQMMKSLFPVGHPYSWTVIGSMEDLNAATLSDVKEWFKTHYGAANAVLSIAGDVQAADVLKRVEKYFGNIPAGPPLTKQRSWVAKRHESTRDVMQDRVPLAQLTKVWNVPEASSPEMSHLDLASDVLGSGKNSRLYERLVYRDQIASDVSAWVEPKEIAGLFLIEATARPGVSLEKIDAVIGEELSRFLKDGPTSEELDRIKTQHEARFLRGIERIGGFGGKSDVLAAGLIYNGDPNHYKTYLRQVRAATKRQLQEASNRWLSTGDYNLEVHPRPEYVADNKGVDRSKSPYPTNFPEAKFPKVQEATLENGIQIYLVERRDLPLLNLGLVLGAGTSSDALTKPGITNLAMAMLTEGTEKLGSLELNAQLERLGAELGAGSDLDSSSIYLSALRKNLDASLELYADVILRPSFPEADFNRLKKNVIDGISREKSDPTSIAHRVMPKLLFGQKHPYGVAGSGSGTVESIQSITIDDVRSFHKTWFQPKGARIIVVGDTTMPEIKEKLFRLFGKWRGRSVPEKNVEVGPTPAASGLYLIDRPGAVQSFILAAEIAPPIKLPDEIIFVLNSDILGGTFTSRLNMNLREDKHWAYRARSYLGSGRGPRAFGMYAGVQTDKTKESLLEMIKEAKGIVGRNPITPAEMTKAKTAEVLELSGRWESSGAVGSTVNTLIERGYPLNIFDSYAKTVSNLTLEDLRKGMTKLLDPSKLIWVVVGDRKQIEKGLSSVGLGPVHLLDADAQPVK